jgi:hypothetical protein
MKRSLYRGSNPRLPTRGSMCECESKFQDGNSENCLRIEGGNLSDQSILELLAFPFRRLSLETPLAQADVVKRLEENVEPRSIWRFSAPQRDFEGVVSMTAFKIFRIIRRRNSFLPIIIGRVQPRVEGGTRIAVTMRMRWSVSAFVIAWESILVALLTVVLLGLHWGGGAYPKPQAGSPGLYAMLIGLIIFGYCLTAIAFNIEALRARQILIGILETAPA